MNARTWGFLWEFLRFNIVGIVNTVLTFLVFSGVFYLTRDRILSLAVDYTFGLGFSYIMNSSFTFRAGIRDHRRRLPRMVLSYGLLMMVNWLLLKLFVDFFALDIYLSQLMTVAFIATGSYLLQRVLVFEMRKHGNS